MFVQVIMSRTPLISSLLHLILIQLTLLLLAIAADGDPCAPKHYDSSSSRLVCVCNATYCDDFPPLGEEITDPSKAVLFTSSLAGLRFDRQVLEFTNQNGTDHWKPKQRILVRPKLQRTRQNQAASSSSKKAVRLSINSTQQFQTILGFGGAFTDAVGINLNSLSNATKDRLLQSYFGETGIQYTVGRVPMASCDFSTWVYSYDDWDGDFGLVNFTLAQEDFNLKIRVALEVSYKVVWVVPEKSLNMPIIDYERIPNIQRARDLASPDSLNLFASPWSAPGWMKESGSMVGGGELRGDFNGDYYATWAQYFIRFFEEYSKAGVNFWGLTLQNEPSTGAIPGWKWQALYYSAKMQRDFVRDLLGPSLKNNSRTRGLKLMVNDDQRFWLPSNADTIFADANASQYIDGVGVHWYADFLFSAQRLTDTHNAHPEKFILGTEACNGYLPLIDGPRLGDWYRGEAYGKDIIDDLENWAVGWTDWNLCLDAEGGPNFAGNFVDSPVIVNATADEFYKQPMYYVLGHFAKFVRPGAVRLGLGIRTNVNKWTSPRLGGTAYWDGKGNGGIGRYVLVMQNRHGTNDYNVTMAHPNDANRTLNFQLGKNSIATLVWGK